MIDRPRHIGGYGVVVQLDRSRYPRQRRFSTPIEPCRLDRHRVRRLRPMAIRLTFHPGGLTLPPPEGTPRTDDCRILSPRRNVREPQRPSLSTANPSRGRRALLSFSPHCPPPGATLQRRFLPSNI